MNFWDKVMIKWKRLGDSLSPILQKLKSIAISVGRALRILWKHLFAMRRVFVSIPVAIAAVILAIRNQASLPAVVGLNLQTNGTFSIQISREIAVLGSLAVTALCLLLVLCSKRTLTPWLVSVFSLVIPIVIWFTNTFPA